MAALPASVASPSPLSSALASPGSFDAMAAQHDTEMQQHTAASEAERAPIAADVNTAAKALSTEVDKPLEKQPLPENTAKHLDPKELNDTASMYMTLGALAGLLTRQPMTAALNNMSAAMEGVQKGDQEQFDRAYGEYQDNFKKAMAANKSMLDEREKIIKDRSLSLTAKEAQLKLVDLKNGAKAQELQRSFKDRMDAHYKQASLTQKTEEAHARLTETIDMHRQQHEDRVAALDLKREVAAKGAAAGVTAAASAPGGSTDVSAWKYLLLGKEPPGMGNKSADQRQMVRDQAARLGKELGLTAQEQALLPTDNAMKVKAADALTKWGAFVDKSSENIKRDLDLVVESARKVDPGSIQAINKAILAGEKEFQDPAAISYALAVNKLNTEYIRLQQGPLSNAMLHVDAAHKADALLSVGISADAWASDVRDMIAAEAANTKASVQSVRGSLMQEVASAGGHAGAAGGAKPLPPKNAKGWTLHRDAKGNQAYVGPNNEVEEVK